ncbi:hypothetical protein BO86DRAFT_394633 [Aspergillus japonicus CBS 114.51]|uniref:Uncharacterized protein n=3 Tax=Aspergillus TaxID=5052 RepID=A0A2V5HBZ6_ASPV1|nr:hypothetical protein BO86DRAFT_394633 [Aspergillus japonicus CBS 114.51]PYI18683.1 hypothetical protein BO99DRAFT_433412 [Aspergillus violaceofuscus CBS 115571]RAH86837.1 hypothetical protein BO86DRAFT_394633 [Aspergillus japonicus CBS 114.51]
MMFEGVLSWFRPAEAEVVQETSWDPVTLTMIQPKSPVAPTTDEIVTDQPILGEGMDLRLRGGDSAEDGCCFCCRCCSCLDSCCAPDDGPGQRL